MKIRYIVCDRCGSQTDEDDWGGFSMVTENDRVIDLCPGCNRDFMNSWLRDRPRSAEQAREVVNLNSDDRKRLRTLERNLTVVREQANKAIDDYNRGHIDTPGLLGALRDVSSGALRS